MSANLLTRIADGRTDLILDYLEQGGDASGKDSHGTSLIQWCAYYGDTTAVRLLVQRGEQLSALGENYDLNGVVFHGHWRLCQFLLESGADPNHPLDDTQETPLHAALCKRNRPAYAFVVQLLLAHGAKPNCHTRPGVETGCFMRDCRTRGETPLHRAAIHGTGESIKLLLAAGASRDARDAQGDTPLAWASWANRPAYILDALCWGDYRIHPVAVERSLTEQAHGWGGMERHLLGELHLDAE